MSLAPRRLLKYSTSLLTHKLAGTRAIIFTTDLETLPPGYFLAEKRLGCSCKIAPEKNTENSGQARRTQFLNRYVVDKVLYFQANKWAVHGP